MRTIPNTALPLVLALAMAVPTAASAVPGPALYDFGSHDPVPADRRAIEALLHTYTQAVSNRDEALFRTLLLNDQVPFSGTGQIVGEDGHVRSLETRNFAAFRKGVFESPMPFEQRFYHVQVHQDGSLAQVSLDFVNRFNDGSGGWGWKTIQLLKLDGRWKIASEFYTGHPLPKPA